ncbi:MAG TPA: purine/pyrimidine permease [Bacillota bacterium]
MSMKYQLDEQPPFGKGMLYAFQWLVFNFVNIGAMPVVMGTLLGLDQAGIASLGQRTLFLMGLTSLLQVSFGHRLPIIEGPSGIWMGVVITMSSMASLVGKSPALLRTDLSMGIAVAGVVLIGLGLTGWMRSIVKLFTPAVTGTVMILLTLQLSETFIQGMLGITPQHDTVHGGMALTSLITISTVIIINLKGKGFIKSLAVIIGGVVGWGTAALFGLTAVPKALQTGFLSPPNFFAWGWPTFDLSVVVVSILTGLLVLPNAVASIVAMEHAIERRLQDRAYNRAVILTGVSDILAGLGCNLGFYPIAASAGMVSLTAVGSRKPFIISAFLLMMLGFIPKAGEFLSVIPAPVGCSIMISSFAQMFVYGIKDLSTLKLDTRTSFIIGLPILTAVGIITIPSTAFRGIPVVLRYVLSNGLLFGMIVCLLLEHVFLAARFFKERKSTKVELNK